MVWMTPKAEKPLTKDELEAGCYAGADFLCFPLDHLEKVE